VLVHFHGGGFFEGNGDGDYTLLADTGHDVVVSLNYRLGIFGFLADRGLGPHAGDYGLQDQQAALRWIEQNIRSFGGDPDNVTLFGESAGAAAVCDQLASPSAAGLFDKAISASGEYNNLFGSPAAVAFEVQDCKAALPTQAQAADIGSGFAAAVGCSNGRDVGMCLRNVPADEALRAAGSGYQYGGRGTIAPTLNGTTLPRTLRDALRSGRVNRVPVIAGNGRDENVVGLATSTAQYEQLVQAQYARMAPRVLSWYPASDFPSPFIAWRTVAADSNTVCPALVTDLDLARWMPVYGYEIDDGNAPPAVFLPPTEPNGAYHAADWYVYVEGRFAPPPPTADEAALQAQEVAEVTSFAKTGAPAATNTPGWPEFGRSGAVLSLAPRRRERAASGGPDRGNAPLRFLGQSGAQTVDGRMTSAEQPGTVVRTP
jgi:para-nitrobenzyl esterase